MIINDFFKWIKGTMTGEHEVTVTTEQIEHWLEKTDKSDLSIYLFALNSAINVLSGALSKCEIRTFYKGQERKSDEYYLWNYEPNANENASQFMQKIVWHLIFKGECLIVPSLAGDLLVADSYTHERYANYQDTFQGVVVDLDGAGSYQIDKVFYSKDVLFYKYNNKNISEILAVVMGEYERLLKSAVDNCLRAQGEHGILKIDQKAAQINYGKKEDGTPRTFNDVYREMMNDQFKAYFKNQNAVMPLWEGMSYESQGSAAKRSTSEVKDLTDITNEIFDRVANALQIPPAILKGNIADVDELTRNMITFAIDPIAKMMERENNRKRNGKKVLSGTYQMIDTSRIMHNEALDVADKAFNLIGAGWSIDEVREKCGDAPLNTEWSQQHYLSLNFTQYENIGKERNDESDGTT